MHLKTKNDGNDTNFNVISPYKSRVIAIMAFGFIIFYIFSGKSPILHPSAVNNAT